MKVVETKPDRKSMPTRGIKGSPQIWMSEKRERDAELWGVDTSKYWIIENKLYDLTPFIDRHPGGSNWLTMTKGQDVTDFFIIHHINEGKAREVLDKYYVGETKNKVSRFSFEEDGLYRTVKRELLKEMTVKEIQDETTSKIYGIILFVLLCLCIGLSAYTIDAERKSYLPYFFGALSSLFLISMVGIGHNFIHHKPTVFKYFLTLTGFTHDEWQIMHCLSHHLYPNTELDFEAAALEPIGFFLRNLPENHMFTEVVLVLLFMFLQPLNFILKLFVVPILRKRKPDFWYLVPSFVILTFYYTTGNFWFSLKLHFFIYGVFGLIFNRVLFCGHRLQELWTEGAERIEDFGEHTVLATNDTDTWMSGFMSYLFLAGFNIHTPHHFFPTADLMAHPRIIKIIERECQKKGIKHFETSRAKCFVSLTKGILHRIPFVRK